jgi:uncharacterized protein
MRTAILIFSTLLVATAVLAKQSRIDKAARTIDVVANGFAEADADVAIITVSCKNYGPTEQAAYEENARAGNRLIEALVKAGTSKKAIETSTVEVNETNLDRDWTPEQKIAQKFQARQSLTLTVKTKNASSVADLAMHSGANSLDSVKWELRDSADADAKATSAALANAKAIATQLAQGTGTKVGSILSLSNNMQSREFDQLALFAHLSEDVRWITKSGTEPISLFPEKIKESVNVHVVFAME